MTTARQRILSHLKKVRTATAREIGRALEMEAPTVRHHLSMMVGDGRVEIQQIRRLTGRGRPEKLYSLGRSTQGNNLAGLSAGLLKQAGSDLRIDELAAEMLGPTTDETAQQTIGQRLASLITRLNEMRYEARWEAGAKGPHIILGLCPYREIIDEHPELCSLDAAMIRQMLGGKAEQKSRLSPACIFITR